MVIGPDLRHEVAEVNGIGRHYGTQGEGDLVSPSGRHAPRLVHTASAAAHLLRVLLPALLARARHRRERLCRANDFAAIERDFRDMVIHGVNQFAMAFAAIQ